MVGDYQSTSHVATLPCGQSIFYTDSGAPSTSTYTTFVALHGTGFTGKTFYPLLPFALKNGLRFIIPNRPDYAPSSLLSQSELDDYNTGNIQSVQRNATWLSQFLLHIIKEGQLPKVKQNAQNQSKEGGVVILAWSMGVITALPLFYALGPGWLEEGAYEVLKGYLWDLVLYEPVSGYPLPSSLFSPSIPPDSKQKIYLPYAPSHPKSSPNGEDVERRTKEEIIWDFGEWIGGYYEHPYHRRHPGPAVQSGEEATIGIEDFDWTRNYSKTTVENMCEGVKRMIVQEGLLDWEAASRSEVPEVSDFDTRDALRRHLSDTVFGLRDAGALLPASFVTRTPATPSNPAAPSSASQISGLNQLLFPDVPITYISGTHTAGICSWNAAQDARRWRESSAFSPSPSAGALRAAKWVLISGGNHFAHWDTPELFLRGVVAGIAAKDGERVVV